MDVSKLSCQPFDAIAPYDDLAEVRSGIHLKPGCTRSPADLEGPRAARQQLQRTKEVENRLLVVTGQFVEGSDHAVGLGCRVRRNIVARIGRRCG